ncbi:MAG: tetratricopeptide repeat protein [Elusimicrobiota bacterium]
MRKMDKKKIITALIVAVFICRMSAGAIYRKHPEKTPYYHYLMGRIYIHKGQIGKAIDSIEEAVRLDLDSWTIRWDLLELYYITGDYWKARELGIKMYGSRPNDPKFLELLADIFAHTKDPDKALETYAKIIEVNPDNDVIRLNIAALHEKEKEYKSALKQYIIILKNDPSNVYARLALADIYLELKKYNTAVKNYLTAIKYGAESKEVYMQIARVYGFLKEHRKAEKYLRLNLEDNPRDVHTLFLMAELYQEEKKHAEALEVLFELRDATNDGIAVLLRLGTLYSEMEEIEKASLVFKEVTELYPDEFMGWYLLGLTYEFQGENELSLNALLTALVLRTDEQVLFHLGVVNDRMGNAEEAFKMFDRCLELDPDHPGAHNYIGYTWAEKGINLDKAEQHIMKALNTDPENAAYIDSLGWVYYKQERHEEALKKLKAAVVKIKDDPVIFEHLGDIYLKLNQKSEAKSSYKRALELAPENDELKTKIKELEN